MESKQTLTMTKLLEKREFYQGLDLVLTPESAVKLGFAGNEDDIDYPVCLRDGESCRNCAKTHDSDHTVQVVQEGGSIYLRHNGGPLYIGPGFDPSIELHSLITEETYKVHYPHRSNLPGNG